MSTFCPNPWIHLASMPFGQVPLCHDSDHKQDSSRNFKETGDEILNLNTHSIVEIVNSDYFKQVRLQFLNNEIPSACKTCFDEEAAGIESKRIISLQEFQLTEDDAVAMTSSDGTIPLAFEELEFRLGNACNLKCTMCNPWASSMWTKEYKVISQKLDFLPEYNFTDTSNFKWYCNTQFWNDLSDASANVRLVYINGGEPLLDKQHASFLKKLNAEAKIRYSTNGTIIPAEVVDTWSRFQQVRINVSLDDIGQRAEYIRYPAKWNTLIDNIRKFNDIEHIDLSIVQTVSIYNVFYIKEFKEYFDNLGIFTHFNFLKVPEFLSIGHLPDYAIAAVLEKHKDQCYIEEIKKFFSLFDTISIDEKIKNMHQFNNYANVLDTLRGTSFNDVFSEWAEILRGKQKT